MAGVLLPVIPKRVFNFSNIGTGTNQSLIIADRIDISQHIDAMFALRVHAASITSGNLLTFDLFGDGCTEEDPGLTFSTALPIINALNITTSNSPQLLTYGGLVRGHYGRVVVTALKTVAGNLSATVSLDLILRSPDRLSDEDRMVRTPFVDERSLYDGHAVTG